MIRSSKATALLAATLCMSIGWVLAGCARRAPATEHEAYIWQRQWTPAVVAAVSLQQSVFAGWRVLGLQVIGSQKLVIRPDLEALASSARLVRLVVRIEGARGPLAVPELMASLSPLVDEWRGAGLDLSGIEIDHDCATAALDDYASWLRELRGAMPRELKLSITALPSWLDSPALEQLLAAVDDSVLQVHAVQRPDRALFDAARARAWTLAYAARTVHPFALALPAYSVRVDTDAQGRVRAVDAEADIERSGASGRELRADPREVAKLLRELADDGPEHLSGYLWFRLPVAGDRRSWSGTTLAAVIGGQALEARFVVESAINAGGSATSSATVTVTPPVSTVPNAPTNTTSTVNGTLVRIGWRAPASGPAVTSYRLDVGTKSGASNIASGLNVGNVLAVSGNLPRGRYFVRVRAANTAGVSSASSETNFWIGKRLLSPTGFNVRWVGSTAVFTWTQPVADAADVEAPSGYVLEAGTTPGEASISVPVGNVTSFSAPVPSGTYYVRVKGVGEGAESDPTQELILTPPGAPGAPTALTESGSAATVTLRWQAPASGGAVTAYQIEAGSAPGLSDLAVVQTGNIRSFSTPIPAGTYYVRVRALNGSGPGPVSNEVVVRR